MYQLGLYEKAMPNRLSWPEKLTAAKKAGFDFVELSIDESGEKLSRLDWGRTQRKTLSRDMQDCDICFGSLCLSAHRKYPLGSHDPTLRAQSLIIAEKAIHLATDLGIRMIQLAGYDVYYETPDRDTERWFTDNLAQCVSTAASEGVLLGFETMETPFMDTVKKAMGYVGQINSPYLQIYPDIGNLTNAAVKYRHDWKADLYTGIGHLAAMHLKETVPGVYREIPFGTGHVDFLEAVQTAKRLGVRRFTGEFWYDGSENWEEALSQSYTFLHHFLSEE